MREEKVISPRTTDQLCDTASAVGDILWERYAAAKGAPFLSAEEEWQVFDLLISLVSSAGVIAEAFLRGQDEGLLGLYKLIESQLWEEGRDVPLKRHTIPTHVRRRVLERDEYRCQDCGSTERLHVDHIIPVSRGGPNHVANLRVLCRSCNLSKGATI